jgi:hypothetical protein
MNENPAAARQPSDNSPEYVAMKMTETILIYIENGAWNQISRSEYLDTYTECLEAVRGLRKRAPRRVEAAAAESNGAFEFERAQF